jgi:dihydroflavonol-4-reductase
MRVLVIGATGFLGLNLLDELLAEKFTVRVAHRKHSPTLLLRKRGVERVIASLQEPESLRQAMTDCDVVYLVAGYYPKYSTDFVGSLHQGVIGVHNACVAAMEAGVEKFIYTSSVGSLDRAPAGRPADEIDIPDQMPEDSVYRAVKWAMEREVERAMDHGLPAVTLLPGACVGPWDIRLGTGAMMVGVIREVLPFWVPGYVNVVDVGDVARAHVRALEAPVGSRYCLAGQTVDFGWLLRHIAERFGGRAPETCLMPEQARAWADREERRASTRKERVAFPRELVDLITTGQAVSSARAERELYARFRPLDDSLDRAYAWFERFGFFKTVQTGSRHGIV